MFLKNLIVLASILLCDGAQYSLGPNGFNSSAVVPFPTHNTYITVKNETVCQKFIVPTGGMVVSQLAAHGYGTADHPTMFEMALYDETKRLSVAKGEWRWNSASYVTLPGQVRIEQGFAWVCLASYNATHELKLGTEVWDGTWYKTSGSDLAGNISLGTGVSALNTTVSIHLLGTSATIFDFPVVQNFDSWPRCHEDGCSIVTGPCAAQDGWQNPDDDDFDWSVHWGETESRTRGRLTGPTSEHTSCVPGPCDLTISGGNYIYAEASPPCGAQAGAPGKVAHLVTPVLAINRGWVLRISFWMHMWGHGDTQLHFDMSFDGAKTWIEDVKPHMQHNRGDAWIQYNLDLTDVVWDNAKGPGAQFRWRSISGNVTEISFEGDVALDDITILAYTQTPSFTETPTETPTQSTTLTTIPTTTPTATMVPTYTPTDTQTATTIRPYVPIGIPDPFEMVNQEWMSVTPMQIVQNEIASLEFRGKWLYGRNEQIDIKFGIWEKNCIDMAPGSKIATLDRHNIGKIQAPSQVGRFMLCMRHRQDWENVGVVDVIPQSANYTIYGYTTCEQMIRFNPEFCGCWYQKGDQPLDNADNYPTYTLPLDKPQWLMLVGNETALFEQGCCRRGSKKRSEGLDHNQAYWTGRWGTCSDHDAKGQLGDFSCPAMKTLMDGRQP
mmetsp:Transcript_136526/g.236937  ORF Transcript_136526/g.236937 Transcript_136526/m.236937 type:complete len:666 (-) Transcript_136526:296-2293(-)